MHQIRQGRATGLCRFYRLAFSDTEISPNWEFFCLSPNVAATLFRVSSSASKGIRHLPEPLAASSQAVNWKLAITDPLLPDRAAPWPTGQPRPAFRSGPDQGRPGPEDSRQILKQEVPP